MLCFTCFDVRLRRRAVNLQLVVDSSITGAVAAARNLQLRSALLAIGPAEFPFSPFDLGKLFLHSMKKTVAGSRRRVSLFRHVRTPSFFPGAHPIQQPEPGKGSLPQKYGARNN